MAKGELSPEEKLLKVIQEDGENETEKAGSDSTPTVTGVTAPSTAAGAAKPAAAASVPARAASAPRTGSGPSDAAKAKPGPALRAEPSKPKPVSAPAAEAKPGTASKPAAEAAKPRLAPGTKVPSAASAEAVVAGPARGATAPSVPPVGTSADAVPVPRSAPKGMPARSAALVNVNRALAAIAAVMLVLLGMEFWRGVQAFEEQVPRPPSVGGATGSAQPDESPLTGVEEFLSRLEGRLLWHPEDVAGPTSTNTPSGLLLATEQYVKAHMDLIGRSTDANGEAEAVVVDRKTEKMYVLKAGQEFVAGEKNVKLLAIGADEVVLFIPSEKRKVTLR